MNTLFRQPLLFLFLLATLCSCAQKKSNLDNFTVQGRHEELPDGQLMLIGSASSVAFDFTGNTCAVLLQSVDSWEHNNYVALELDGEYLGRITVEKGPIKSYPITVKKQQTTHRLVIYKATEAANGGILFNGAAASVVALSQKKKSTKIEFIGNSITCGMGNDTKEIPCDTGQWFDQHNAYWAYGPIIARKLNADFLLSSVSGIGMYRNWNDENRDEAIMPDVYENLYLNKDNTKPYDFSFKPDIISIALGTNDFSDGDGKKERLPFNAEKFISNYTAFIKMLYKHHPKAQIVIINSPMVNGDKALVYTDCLNKIKDNFKTDLTHQPIQIFQFKEVTPHGCGYHPDIDDHKLMAEQYAPFLKKIIDEK